MGEPVGRLAGVLTSDVDATDEVVARILDAARDQFAHFGIRRTSIDDIAKRAGLGRNTVFRRLGSKDELVAAVMQRELRRLIDQVDAVAARATGITERLADAFAVTVAGVRTNPMVVGALAYRRDEVLTLATTEGAALLRVAVDYVTGLLAGAQERGEIPTDVDVAGAAEVIVRTLQSIVLTPTVAHPLDTEDDLKAFATAHLAPLLGLRRPV